MKKYIFSISFLLAIASTSLAEIEEHKGAEIFFDNCASGCHAHATGIIFTRKNRRARSLRSLAGWVSNCITQMNVEMFPEDEALVVDYLNKKFYKYK